MSRMIEDWAVKRQSCLLAAWKRSNRISRRIELKRATAGGTAASPALLGHCDLLRPALRAG